MAPLLSPYVVFSAGAILGIIATELLREFMLSDSGTSSASAYRVALSSTSWSLPVAAVADTPTSDSDDVDFFTRAVQAAYDEVFDSSETHGRPRKPLDLPNWKATNRTTTGGLNDMDRLMLSQIYFKAESVFEFGLGESTAIASAVGVPRYAGLDSDAVWVAMAARNAAATSSPHFRFYYGDIGETVLWGKPAGYDRPNFILPTKAVLDYCVAPLVVEPRPFDVYMVDGRFRMPLVILSFLHAAARGGDITQTTVLLHDHDGPIANKDTRKIPDFRDYYYQGSDLLDLHRHSGGRLSAFRRKPSTTNAQLYDIYKSIRQDWR
jgi:hypothetical protein